MIGIPSGADLDLDLRLESVMEGVLVSGEIRAPAVGQCVRCLDDLELPLQVDVQELVVYPGRAEGEDEFELQGDLIDFEPILRDAVVPAMPFQPMCDPDCPGLCSECGARLADDPGHAHEVLDPRWSALQTLVDGADARPAGSDEKEN